MSCSFGLLEESAILGDWLLLVIEYVPLLLISDILETKFRETEALFVKISNDLL